MRTPRVLTLGVALLLMVLGAGAMWVAPRLGRASGERIWVDEAAGVLWYRDVATRLLRDPEGQVLVPTPEALGLCDIYPEDCGPPPSATPPARLDLSLPALAADPEGVMRAYGVPIRSPRGQEGIPSLAEMGVCDLAAGACEPLPSVPAARPDPMAETVVDEGRGLAWVRGLPARLQRNGDGTVRVPTVAELGLCDLLPEDCEQ